MHSECTAVLHAHTVYHGLWNTYTGYRCIHMYILDIASREAAGRRTYNRNISINLTTVKLPQRSGIQATGWPLNLPRTFLTRQAKTYTVRCIDGLSKLRRSRRIVAAAPPPPSKPLHAYHFDPPGLPLMMISTYI